MLIIIRFLGQKKFKFDELLAIVSELKKEVKDQGCYEDFIECLKLYDKNANGLMLSGELSHSLLTLGMFKNVTNFAFNDSYFRGEVNGRPSGRIVDRLPRRGR